jgi:hypothetical protein
MPRPPIQVTGDDGRLVVTARLPGITQLVQRYDLPAGVNAMATADLRTIMVRPGIDEATRKRAIREVLAAGHRSHRQAVR